MDEVPAVEGDVAGVDGDVPAGRRMKFRAVDWEGTVAVDRGEPALPAVVLLEVVGRIEVVLNSDAEKRIAKVKRSMQP